MYRSCDFPNHSDFTVQVSEIGRVIVHFTKCTDKMYLLVHFAFTRTLGFKALVSGFINEQTEDEYADPITHS